MPPTSRPDAPDDATGTRLRLADLPRRASRPFRLEPGPEVRRELARTLDLIDLRKLRFEGKLTPQGKQDWALQAKLGATVVQPCVVTTEPVTTRIDEPVARTFSADWREPDEDESETPDDDIDPLPETLDLAEVMAEALALALPLYPRAPGVESLDLTQAPPGAAPIQTVKPFAGLQQLKDSLDKAEGED